MKFNENLKYLRKRENLTQEELAERLNVSRQTITKWESGNSLPDIKKIKEIAYIFSVSVDSLIGEISNRRTNKLKKKINDIGWILGTSFLLAVLSNVSIDNFLIKVIPNIDYAIGLMILTAIITIIYIIITIKKYLLNNNEEIINMKNDEQGKKERKKYIAKKYLSLFYHWIIFSITFEIETILDGYGVFLVNVLYNIFQLVVLIIVFGIVEYKTLEKKIKELE